MASATRSKAVHVHPVQPLVALVLHGGCFSGGTPANAAELCRSLERAVPGLECVALKFDMSGGVAAVDRDVDAALCRLEAEGARVLVVGSSSGGYHAMRAAARAQGVLVGALLFAPVLDPAARAAAMERIASSKSGATDRERARAASILSAQRAFFGTDAIKPAPHSAPVPVLIVQGDDDANVPPSARSDWKARATASETAGGAPVVWAEIVGAGHEVSYKARSDVEERVTAFVRDHC